MRYGIPVGGVAVLSLAIAPTLASPAPSARPDVKCGPQPPGTTALLAIDGEIRDAPPPSFRSVSPAAVVDPEDIFWIDIVCIDPLDSTFQRGHGVPVVSIWTKRGPASHMEPALLEIRTAQNRHFERQGRYLEGLDAIELSEHPPQVHVAMEVTSDADGYVASARTERLFATCFLYDGAAGAPRAGLVPGEPDCVSDR